MEAKTQTPYTHYLMAKKSLDDRSLNRHVYGKLAREIAKLPPQQPLRVLEVGAGCGTMLTRLIEWGLLRSARYTAVDQRANFVDCVHDYLSEWCSVWDYQLDRTQPDHLMLARGENLVHINLKQRSLEDYLQSAGSADGAQQPDLIIAHAFLDLVDLSTTLPKLIAQVRPGGFLYLTLNFDGETILEPSSEPELQDRILQQYHASMDHRRTNGRPAGDSRTGRRLLSSLLEAGLPVLAAGSSDWVIVPGQPGYMPDERAVLDTVLDTIAENVTGGPDLDESDVQRWLQERRARAAAGQLIYIAHQLDVLAQKPAAE